MKAEVSRLKKYILLIRNPPSGTDRAALFTECEQICYKYIDALVGSLRARAAFAAHFNRPGFIMAPLRGHRAARFDLAIMVMAAPFFALECLCRYAIRRARIGHNIGTIMHDLDLIMTPVAIGIPFFVTRRIGTLSK